MALFQVTRSCWCSTGRPGGAHEFNLGFLGLGTEIDVLFLNGMVLVECCSVKKRKNESTDTAAPL